MRHRELALLALFLIIISPAYAQTVDRIGIDADISAAGSVTQEITYTFSSPVTEERLNYSLAGVVRGVEITDDKQQLNYNLSRNQNGSYTLQISLKEPTDKLTIKYTADDVVFRADSVSHFFTEFSFDSAIPQVEMTARLPAGYVLYQNSFRPASGSVATDGERIMVVWNEQNVSDIFFSVKFFDPNSQEVPVTIVVLAFAAAIIVLFYLYRLFRAKNRAAFLHGFREDEKRTIHFLEQRGTALQSDLQKEFRFSRAKATRVVTNLEQKGLVSKKRYGRTNMLTWIKKAVGNNKKESEKGDERKKQ